MREIEIKYRVADPAALLVALERAGVVMGQAVLQDDQAYAPADWTPGTPRIGRTFCRLRTQDGLHVFTTKTPTADPMEHIEHETAVADRGQMHAAVLRMGYVPSLRVVKYRRTGVVREMLVCLDEVADLGAFLELEVVADDDRDGSAVRAELDAWARGLGVQLEHTTLTYDILVRVAQGA
ncbi:adenylate cyclase [Nocardiopsis sp. CNR-923]|uniref:class IV adenylate cyclase n=1 Tax=Nocardiopsis sp. CNR-923 TaxID=1904965 RepID=UPI000968D5A3|nr:CYTH domain-containing protein [Nocardiopsis sp. CNR-923]OLT30592.1 adenylate cyclase [Nocardiopsis sp. CNR-923]